jgi:hypothetical protein
MATNNPPTTLLSNNSFLSNIKSTISSSSFSSLASPDSKIAQPLATASNISGLSPLAPRSYTILKEVGDGSFGTVSLADWHSPLNLPKGTLPPGPSSRAEYRGKQLVAIKRMKKPFQGGWEECIKLKELKVS